MEWIHFHVFPRKEFGPILAKNKNCIKIFFAGSERLHERWRARRAGRPGYADAEHPFRWHGSADVNTYKLFLEQCHALLRAGGQLGMILPSGIYTDKGSTELRRLFLTRCRWRWLFGFENREKIFDIHRSFKFAVVVAHATGRPTEAFDCAFYLHDAEWLFQKNEPLRYTLEFVKRTGGEYLTFIEPRTPFDFQVLASLYQRSRTFGEFLETHSIAPNTSELPMIGGGEI